MRARIHLHARVRFRSLISTKIATIVNVFLQFSTQRKPYGFRVLENFINFRHIR